MITCMYFHLLDRKGTFSFWIGPDRVMLWAQEINKKWHLLVLKARLQRDPPTRTGGTTHREFWLHASCLDNASTTTDFFIFGNNATSKFTWLVVKPYPFEKDKSVGNIIPNIIGHIKFMFQTTNLCNYVPVKNANLEVSEASKSMDTTSQTWNAGELPMSILLRLRYIEVPFNSSCDINSLYIGNPNQCI